MCRTRIQAPWRYVAPDQLPPDFAKIPQNSDKGDVLAHVSGTPAADDAVANNEIPQTAAVDRRNTISRRLITTAIRNSSRSRTTIAATR